MTHKQANPPTGIGGLGAECLELAAFDNPENKAVASLIQAIPAALASEGGKP